MHAVQVVAHVPPVERPRVPVDFMELRGDIEVRAETQRASVEEVSCYERLPRPRVKPYNFNRTTLS